MKFTKECSESYERIKRIIKKIKLQKEGNMTFCLENNQVTGSYKVRGVTNYFEKNNPTNPICASAGNHGLGFAYNCQRKSIQGKIYVPENIPEYKIRKFQQYSHITIEKYGDNVDETIEYAQKQKGQFIHPFNDEEVIYGQGTLGIELSVEDPSTIFIPIGGGGLVSGVGTVLKKKGWTVIGVEPENAASMKAAIRYGKPVEIEINTIVDSVAVRKVGSLSFQLAKACLDDILTFTDEEILKTQSQLGVNAEPAGALAVCATKRYGGYAIISGGM